MFSENSYTGTISSRYYTVYWEDLKSSLKRYQDVMHTNAALVPVAESSELYINNSFYLIRQFMH